MNEFNSVPIPVITESERRIFEKIDSLVLQGAVFLENEWMKGGYFKIKVEYRSKVISYNCLRSHPRIFGPSSS